MRYTLGMLGLFVLLPSFVFAQTEGNIASYFANKKFDTKTISAFLKAAETGNQKLVSDYLAKDSAIANVTDNRGNTALMLSTMANDLPLMKLLANNGAKVNTTNKEENSALCFAVRRNGPEAHIFPAVDLLLKLNAHVNVVCNGAILTTDRQISKYTPLHAAVVSVRPNVIEALIKKGADVNKMADYAYTDPVSRQRIKAAVTPFDVIGWGFREEPTYWFGRVVSPLLEAKAKFEYYKNPKDLLSDLLWTSGHDGLLEVLFATGIIPKDFVRYQFSDRTPLTTAVCYGSGLNKIEILVKYGAKVTDEKEIRDMLECAHNDSAVADYLNHLGYK